jgi:uncharacterized protein YchJ
MCERDIEIYEKIIKDLEDRLRDSINANSKARVDEINAAKYKIAFMYARLIDDLDRSKHSPEALESLVRYSQRLLKEEMNFVKEDKCWYFINANGEKVKIKP